MNELSPQIQIELDKRYRTAAFVFIAQIVMALVLIAVAWFLAQTSENEATSQSLFTLWLVILFIAVGSFILRRALFNWERLSNIAVLKGIPGLLQTLQNNSILLGSLGELIAVIGFLVAILSGDKWEMFRAGAVAMIVFLANFPRKATWQKIVANQKEI
ncbi:MAG TPA: hypothetical protein VK892_15040 [Pyrinomonadaceae bacterium]|nr:hypothetical protein [Pyrinomonadaceae bacterium]